MTADTRSLTDAPTCGTCRFGALQPTGQIICYGAPPSPVMVGQRPGRFGGMELQLESLRPVVRPDERACSLHATALLLDFSAVRAVAKALP